MKHTAINYLAVSDHVTWKIRRAWLTSGDARRARRRAEVLLCNFLPCPFNTGVFKLDRLFFFLQDGIFDWYSGARLCLGCG